MFATRAARADLYGDAINHTLVVAPGAALTRALVRVDRVGVDGLTAGGPAKVAVVGQVLRLLQNGYVRSYALSVVGGGLVVVLSLLAVNLA